MQEPEQGDDQAAKTDGEQLEQSIALLKLVYDDFRARHVEESAARKTHEDGDHKSVAGGNEETNYNSDWCAHCEDSQEEESVAERVARPDKDTSKGQSRATLVDDDAHGELGSEVNLRLKAKSDSFEELVASNS